MPTLEADREDRLELPSALRKLITPRDRLPAGSPVPELFPPVSGPVIAEVQALAPGDAAASDSFSHGFISGTATSATIDIWVRAQGLPFAITAFAEYAKAWATQSPSSGNHQLRRAPIAYRVNRGSESLMRLLEHVRTASDGDYAASVSAVEQARRLDASGMVRALSLFLFPDRRDWHAEDLPAFRKHVLPTDHAMILSVIGADATPDLTALFDEYDEENRDLNHMYHSTQELEQIVRLLSWLPRDEAMQALIDRSEHKLVGPQLVAAAKRFPRRAVRMLAEAKPAKTVTAALRLRVLSAPELADAVLPELSAGARGRVEAILATRSLHPVAAADRLPSVLATPPWLARRTAPKPLLISGLTAKAENRIVWLPGERESWKAPGSGWVPDGGWQNAAVGLAEHNRTVAWLGEYFVCYAPDHLVRPLLGTWHAKFTDAALVRGFAARYELLALPTVRDRIPAEQSRLLQPFTGPEIATFMADCLDRPNPARQNARTWFGRHAQDAVRDLTPAAVGPAGVRRTAAEKALRLIAASGWADVAAVAAEEYGAQAGAAVAAMLADDGLHRLPRLMPTVPAWAEPATLPPIVLADRSAALPDEAVRAVVQMLAISKADAPYAGLAHVAAACDCASLAAFVWELFRGWELAGASSKDRWAYDALAVFGDDDTVQRLVPLIRSWPAEGFVKRAIDGLDVLALLGSNAALSALNELGLKGKPPRLRKYALSRVEAAAQTLGLSAEQLADRIVPDLGLAPDGSLRLDYGPRHFVVGFDEQLKPVVTDEAGRRLKTLPKPGLKDDPIPAQAAYQRFSALKKAARTLATEQIARLERAMCGRRSWSAEEFGDLLLGHPLLRHVVRRLVWAVFDTAPENGGAVVGTFRVAEDLSLADAEDEAYRLPEGAAVTIAHPVDLGASAPAWSDVFADYELLQPFQQLGRPVFALSEAERAATILTRFAGRPASPFRIAGLERRGWRRGDVGDGGIWHEVTRPLTGGRELAAQFSPGIAAWGLDGSGPQDISEVGIRTAGSASAYYRPIGTGGALSVLDPVVASEILRDLTEVMEE